MRLGVISDTHGNVAHAAQAVERLRAQRIDVLIHCGDIGSTSVVQEFAEWPTHFVFGNVDRDEALFVHAIRDAGQTCHGRFGEVELGGRKIAIIHGDDSHRWRATVDSGDYDLVCYGHTHQPEFHFVGKTLVLNPGALHRANPHTFAVVDLDTMAVEHLPLNSTD